MGHPVPEEEVAAGRNLDGDTGRLFFALWPAPSVRDVLARHAATEPVAAAGAAPTRPENLHLTLGFLGSVPQQRLREVLEVGAGVRAAPFSFTLDRLEHWAAPAIFCLVPAVVPPLLPALAAELRTALRARSLPADERPYRPHVTLCRKARAPVALHAPATVAGIDWEAPEFVLAESADDTGRSIYRIVDRWPLQPRDPPYDA